MKRDMELIRALMLMIESQDQDDDTNFEIAGYDGSQIDYHLELLIESKLILGEMRKYMGSSRPTPMIERLSWEGHEFLDNARNEPVWKEAMKTIADKGGSTTVGVLTQLLASVAKHHFGLS
jgi:Hypothetical protein (DUF2513)